MVKSRYNIVKCSSDKPCNRCASIADQIVVDRGVHCTLYCSACGCYVKHASIDDKRHFYVAGVKVEDGTPLKVCQLYIDSEKIINR